MPANSPLPLEDQKVKQKFLIEVANTENQLWVLIHSKGLLHSDVQDLYRKVRSSYENLILNDREELELQDVEYSLWKIHYKHIDEFRKRIKAFSANADSQKLALLQHDRHIEGFKLFLSEAIEFYKNLVVKMRKCIKLPEESALYRKKGNCTFAEQKKMQKCRFLCHRFLVCLGDLARYREQYEKPEAETRDWSVAANHYLEATATWPDSGNPHNQLAVLAIYIGDEFLASYHCIRSLAVKEPFPDAQNNLLLLFERNRSSHLDHLSSETHFNFLNPSERSSVDTVSQLSDEKMLKAEHNCYQDTPVWSLIIGTLSFFHIKSSVDEFPCAFASTMRELDAVMAQSDTKLRATLESYQLMDSVKRGPFRALQVVSVLIFIIQNLVKSPERKESTDKNDLQQKELTQLSLTATFIFMGRFVERCVNASAIDTCPLLPAVLVFVEWLVFMLDAAEMSAVDAKTRSAMSYFFAAFVDLLKKLSVNEGESKSPKGTPLWEDYELRGFEPVASVHAALDFLSHWEHTDNSEGGNDFRAQRIINAAITIADRSNGSRKWIVYDKPGKRFCKVGMAKSNEYPERKEPKVPSQLKQALEEYEKQIIAGDNPSSNGKSVDMEEEEVILFRPLTRHNSAPLKISSTLKDPTSPKHVGDENLPSDECLRRATSLLIAQNPVQSDPFSFHAGNITNFRGNMFMQQEPVTNDAVALPFLPTTILPTTIAAGPPSLSAWVLDGRNLSQKEKSTSAVSRQGLRLNPIDEIASESLNGLSITENEDSISSTHEFASIQSSSSTYTTPVPSAPLLPDDADWLNNGIHSSDTSHSQVGSYSNWAGNQGQLGYGSITSSFIDKYPPWHRMTSSEWLRQYRESLNLGHQARPSSLYPTGNLGNLYDYDTSRFNHFNPRGNQAASNLDMHPTLNPDFPLGYDRASPFGCGAVTDLRNEQQSLLQRLKEKERQLQHDPTGRGPNYMGN